MLSDKKSFILYLDYKQHFNLLNNEQKGILISSLFEFAENGEIPVFEDKIVEMAFSFISLQLKRDMDKYDEICERRREAGKLGGRPKKDKLDAEEKANAFFENQTKANKPDNDNGNGTDTENETENETKNETETENENGSEINNTAKPHATPVQTFGDYKNIKLTAEQHKKLVEDYGETYIEDYIQKMDEWIEMRGATPYKDFNLAIRNWLEEDGICQKC
jgi:cobalamin biosynthesis protein CobT